MIDIKEARTADAKPKPPRAAPKPRSTRIRQPRPDPEPQPQNRSQAIQGLFGAIAMPLMVVAPADAAAIALHAEPIGEAVAEVSANDPRFAAIIDRLVHAGPYAALLSAVAPLALQLAANHGYAPVGLLGTMGKEQLIAAVTTNLDEYEEQLRRQGEWHEEQRIAETPQDEYQPPKPFADQGPNGQPTVPL